MTLVEVRYLDADAEHYVLPLAYRRRRSRARDRAGVAQRRHPVARRRRRALRRHGRRRIRRTRWWTGWGGRSTGVAPGASWSAAAPARSRAPGRGRAAAHRAVLRGGAVQHLGQPGRPAAPQVVPQGGAGAQSGPGAGPATSPSTPTSAASRMLAGGLELRTRNARADHAGRAAPVRAQRGRCVDLHPQRAEPLLRARPGRPSMPPSEAELAPRLDPRARAAGPARRSWRRRRAGT